MKVKRVITKLKKKYPGKNIVITDPENPGEIICEVEPSKDSSIAIAVVDKIRPHYHKILTERYEVLRGVLRHHMGDKVTTLQKGDEIEILPGTVHWAEGKETWFKVYSTPGWTPEDHILVK